MRLKNIVLISFSVLIPGATLVCFGRKKSGVLCSVILFAILLIFGATRWITSYEGGVVLLISLSLIHFLSISIALAFPPKQKEPRIVTPILYSIVILSISFVFFKWQSHLLGVQIYRISSTSMEPTLSDGDLALTDTWIFKNSSPSIGDVVVFKLKENGATFIKRVIERPDYAKKQNASFLFIQGDNTLESTDSRHFGAVPPGAIKGKVVYKILPLSKL